MRYRGRLTDWNDERGFGHITPLGGGPTVFVHVSDFPRDRRRPEVPDLVTYSVGYDDQNRPHATGVAFLTPTRSRPVWQAVSSWSEGLAGAAFVSALFFCVLLLLNVAGHAPSLLVAGYLFMSAGAFVIYWEDKAAAGRGEHRTRESSLLALALLGGWPGALLARQLFRHKTRKQPFRTIFWITVAANCTALTTFLLFWPE